MSADSPAKTHPGGKSLARECQLVHAMVRCYCRGLHGQKTGLCPTCLELDAYADKRLEKCPFGDDKPACVHCPIHCYQATFRERMKEVMRYAGPKMLWRHPILALLHLRRARRSLTRRATI